jgi:formylglycine-generating enzyme required for sulfatase activity
MESNPAGTAARQAFASKLSALMLDGANPRGEKRPRWTGEKLAEALDKVVTKTTDMKVAPNSIRNWSQGKFLPIDVEPLIKVFFGAPPTDRKAAESFRRAYKKALAEKLDGGARKANVRGAAQWAPRGEIVAIEDETRASDRSAASDPGQRQLQEVMLDYARELASLLASRRDRHGNMSNVRALREAVNAFAEIAALAPDALLEKLSLAYARTLLLGRLLETDGQTRRTGEGEDPPFDLDVVGGLTDIVRLAAPWMRGFPSVAKKDDDAGKLLARPAALTPSRDFVANALASDAIRDSDAATIEALARASDPRTFPGEKAAKLTVGAANNLLWALARIVAAEQAGAIGPADVAARRLAGKALATLRGSRREIEALSETAPPDAREALRAVVAAGDWEDAGDGEPDEPMEAPPRSASPRPPRVLSPEEERALRPGDRFQEGADLPAMLVLAAGEFAMGSNLADLELEDDDRAWNDEVVPGQGRRRMRIAQRFALGKYPVTFAEYDVFADATGRERPGDANWGRARRPVVNVDWHDATAYVGWLNERLGIASYRLASEAEWEYACRAGTNTRRWWGDAWDPARANGDGKFEGGRTSPVDRFGPNPWGVHGMIGNVWEWCADAWADTIGDLPEDAAPFGFPNKTSRTKRVTTQKLSIKSIPGLRVVRGGSWNDVPRGLRAAQRLMVDPSIRYNFVGFRVARTLLP